MSGRLGVLLDRLTLLGRSCSTSFGPFVLVRAGASRAVVLVARGTLGGALDNSDGFFLAHGSSQWLGVLPCCRSYPGVNCGPIDCLYA